MKISLKFRILLVIVAVIVLLGPFAFSSKGLIELPDEFGLLFARAQGESDSKSLRTIPKQNLIEYISRKVAALGQKRNLKGLKELEDSINAERNNYEIAIYTEIMIKICGGYNSYDFHDPSQYVLARGCAIKALERLEEMPVGRAVFLVTQLGGENEYLLGIVPPDHWEEDRTERAQHWFRAWQILENATIPGFDFDANRPVYHSKMTPEERAKAELYNQQRFLLRDKAAYLNEFQRFVIDSYSKLPDGTNELKDLLEKYVTDHSLRESLMSHVRQNLSTQKEPK